jgi:hypothetical protein
MEWIVTHDTLKTVLEIQLSEDTVDEPAIHGPQGSPQLTEKESCLAVTAFATYIITRSVKPSRHPGPMKRIHKQFMREELRAESSRRGF